VEFMERVKRDNNGLFPYERVIFIDSTWNQTFKICHDPKVVSKFSTTNTNKTKFVSALT